MPMTTHQVGRLQITYKSTQKLNAKLGRSGATVTMMYRRGGLNLCQVFFTERYFFIWSPHHRRHPQCSPPGSCMSGAPRGCGPSAHKKKFTAKHR